eukprot:m.94690 g.94690  ORF g.94690 m.94690 type:complete len:76 (+) comp12420_c0_seq4:4723-4950(+)
MGVTHQYSLSTPNLQLPISSLAGRECMASCPPPERKSHTHTHPTQQQQPTMSTKPLSSFRFYFANNVKKTAITFK